MMEKIICGDAIDCLRDLDAGSVDMCVTSPPYYGLRCYGADGQIGLEETPELYISRLIETFREARRVLRDDGTLWVVIGDSYAGGGKGAWSNKDSQKEVYVPDSGSAQSRMRKTWDGIKPKDLIGIPWMLAFALRADGWFLRNDIIWEKPNSMPSSVKDRCTVSHEYIFMLSKSSKYYFDYEAIKEPCVSGDLTSPRGSLGAFSLHSGRRGSGNKERKQRPSSEVVRKGAQAGSVPWEYTTTRNRRSVWTVPTKPLKDSHFATFPPNLIRPCILAGSRCGGVVLDPFFGAGTTGLVAMQEQRGYIGIDINSEYVELARERLRVCRAR